MKNRPMIIMQRILARQHSGYWKENKTGDLGITDKKNFLQDQVQKRVTVQPLHLLVSTFMKTRSMVGPPYADLDEKVLMQACLQHTFSFKPAHG